MAIGSHPEHGRRQPGSICVYVDELVIMVPETLTPIISALRKRFQTEDLHELYKYLGCFYHLAKSDSREKNIMTVIFHMRDYFRSACELHHRIDIWGQVCAPLHLRDRVPSVSLPLQQRRQDADMDAERVALVAWPDADLNGDFASTKNSGGFVIELAGRFGSSFSLSWASHK